MYQPFAFMASAAGGAPFDPTLGGTITPYFWYDFTDSSQMTLSGTDLTAIASKGSNTNTIAKGSSGAKYTTNYIAPEFKTDYVTFKGTFTGGAYYNSALARRYGTGTSGDDAGFGINNSNTLLLFFKPYWVNTPSLWARTVSWKGYNVTAGNTQPEEWTPVVISDNASYPGVAYYAANSPASRVYSIQSHGLSSVSVPVNANQTGIWSYSGASNVTGGILDNYHCTVVRQTSGGSYGVSDLVAGRNTTDITTAFPGPRNGSSSNFEGLTLGGRSLTSDTFGGYFDIRHLLCYDSALTDQQIEDIISGYKASYPGDNLNA